MRAAWVTGVQTCAVRRFAAKWGVRSAECAVRSAQCGSARCAVEEAAADRAWRGLGSEVTPRCERRSRSGAPLAFGVDRKSDVEGKRRDVGGPPVTPRKKG